MSRRRRRRPGRDLGAQIVPRLPRSCRRSCGWERPTCRSIPATPEPRAQKILDDCGVRLLATTRSLGTSIPGWASLSTIDDDEMCLLGRQGAAGSPEHGVGRPRLHPVHLGIHRRAEGCLHQPSQRAGVRHLGGGGGRDHAPCGLRESRRLEFRLVGLRFIQRVPDRQRRVPGPRIDHLCGRSSGAVDRGPPDRGLVLRAVRADPDARARRPRPAGAAPAVAIFAGEPFPIRAPSPVAGALAAGANVQLLWSDGDERLHQLRSARSPRRDRSRRCRSVRRRAAIASGPSSRWNAGRHRRARRAVRRGPDRDAWVSGVRRRTPVRIAPATSACGDRTGTTSSSAAAITW